MSGFPITLVDSGGAPFVPVTSGAPLATVADGGMPVTLVASGGPPLVVDGTMAQVLGASLLTEFDAEATATLTLAGSAVTTWASTVGAFAPTQATAGNKPSYSATSFGGRPGVAFVTDDYLTMASPALPDAAEECEMWWLGTQAALVADTGTKTALSYGASNAGRMVQRIVATGVNRAQVSIGTGLGNTLIPGATVDFSGIRLARARINATAGFISVDDGPEATLPAVPATVATRLRIGANSNTSAGGFWNGVINYAAITGPLTSAQAAALRAYLGRRL